MPSTRPTSPPSLDSWLRRKLGHFYRQPAPEIAARVRDEATHSTETGESRLFANPFTVADLRVFDDDALHELLARGAMGIALDVLGRALHGQPAAFPLRVGAALPPEQRPAFERALATPARASQVRAAQRQVVDAFFWELVYWKMPRYYDELTAGERLHPGIFARLARGICGRVVLDAAAGAGRATLAALDVGAASVIAVEPSPGLRRILARKVAEMGEEGRVSIRGGAFDALPLPDASVDVALSCSAFTAGSDQGGEEGLAELRRVTKPGGLIVIIWPRPQDYAWLAAHGFQYVALAVPPGLGVQFRSLGRALRLAGLFYARNPAVLRYLRTTGRSDVPYHILGVNPPHDYCWLRVPSEPREHPEADADRGRATANERKDLLPR